MFTCPIERNKAAYAASLVSAAMETAPDYSAIRKPRLFMLTSEKIAYADTRNRLKRERVFLLGSPIAYVRACIANNNPFVKPRTNEQARRLNNAVRYCQLSQYNGVKG